MTGEGWWHHNNLSLQFKKIRSHYFIVSLFGGLRLLLSDSITKSAILFLSLMILLAILGPTISPSSPDQVHYDQSGNIERLHPPSLEYPLGTNGIGQDLLSRILYGARPTVITGALVGGIIFVIGSIIGTISGYVGGVIDDILMRFTDFLYSVPILVAAMVLANIVGGDFFTTIIILGLLLWRGMARVIRSQVLQIKERPYVLAARSTGASRRRILVNHIFPNVAPMAILFAAIGSGAAILVQAGLSFLGVVEPFTATWGVIIRNAYNSGLIAEAWWWSITPGLLISLTVLSAFLIGRGYEDISGQAEDELALA